MTTLEQFVNQFSPVGEAAASELFNSLKTKPVAKGDYLLRQGECCGHLFFVNEGLLKIFSLNGDKEVVMRFFPENGYLQFLTATPLNPRPASASLRWSQRP